MLVKQICFNNSAYGYLHEGDVILEIDGVNIYNNGTVLLQLNPNSKHKYRTFYDILLHRHHVGEEISIKIRRNKELKIVKFPLLPFCYLVPDSVYDVLPSYFIYCGLLFQPLSVDYLRTWKNWKHKAPKLFVHLFDNGIPTLQRQQIVVHTQIFLGFVLCTYQWLLIPLCLKGVEQDPF